MKYLSWVLHGVSAAALTVAGAAALGYVSPREALAATAIGVLTGTLAKSPIPEAASNCTVDPK